MPTCIVNAKVDSYVKERVDSVLKREQKTASEVIKAIWEEIARTGYLPQSLREAEEAEKQALIQQKLDMLHSAIRRSDLPSEYVNRDAKDLLGEILMERYYGKDTA
jgi:antitoxin component of RelBE/YafQ-DinJ toxin-antitoxin module